MTHEQKKHDIYTDLMGMTTAMSEVTKKFYFEKDIPEAMRILSVVKKYIVVVERKVKQLENYEVVDTSKE